MPEWGPLPVLVDADGVVVIDKPAGLATAGRDLQDPACAQAVLRTQLRRDKLWAVHQLDKWTSGLNVFVRRKALVQTWAVRLADPTTRKVYVAVTRGRWKEGGNNVDVKVPIGRRRSGRKTFPALGGADAKPAWSQVTCLQTSERASLVQVRIRSGRTHQVRLHLASLGLPVWGDAMHGADEDRASTLMALHAWRLEVPSATDGFSAVIAPLPRWDGLLDKLGFQFPPPPATPCL